MTARKANKKQGPGSRRPPYKPTDEHRTEVKVLAGVGFSEKIIAQYLEIDPKTLRKHYRVELNQAQPKLLGAAYGTVAHHLSKKDLGAAKYVLSTKGKKYGWGGFQENLPPDVNALLAGADFSKLSDTQFTQLIDLLALCGLFVPDPAVESTQPMKVIGHAPATH